MSEEWRQVPGFPAYEVSRRGVMRKAESKYRPSRNGRRYQLWSEGRRSIFYPHELVDMAFRDDAVEPQASAEPPAREIQPSTPWPRVEISQPTPFLEVWTPALRAREAELKSQIKAAKDEQYALKIEIERLKKKREVNELRSQIVRQTTTVSALADENAALKRENEQLKRLVAEYEAERAVYAVAL